MAIQQAREITEHGSRRLPVCSRRRQRKRSVPVVCGLGLLLYLLSLLSTFFSSEYGSFAETEEHFSGRRLLQSEDLNCTPRSIEQFPPDLFSLEQRQHGAVLIHILVALYIFAALAIVCDDYFVASLEVICEVLGLQTDVAGATFMAVGSSAPELFTSVIGVFIAKSDVGVGTIVGSAVFNILFIVAVCGLFGGMIIHLTWWPLVRDCTWYLFSVLTLVLVILDENIFWYEALAMLVMYAMYIVIMIFNPRLGDFFINKVDRWKEKRRLKAEEHESLIFKDHKEHQYQNHYGALPVSGNPRNDVIKNSWEGFPKTEVPGLGDSHDVRKNPVDGIPRMEVPELGNPHDDVKTSSLRHHEVPSRGSSLRGSICSRTSLEGSLVGSRSNRSLANSLRRSLSVVSGVSDTIPKHVEAGFVHTNSIEVSLREEEEEGILNPFNIPDSWYGKVWWILMLPASLIFFMTIPNCRRSGCWSKLYLATFLLSIVWIAVMSYIMVWMVTVTGHTLGIPDTVMGLTLLAAGTSIPDCLSSVFVARDGYGDMAVSNCIGSNVFDILICLGLPWIIDGLFVSPNGIVHMSSSGLTFSAITLFATVIFLLLAILVNKWRLNKMLGVVFLIVYVCVIALSCLFELNVFGYMNPPPCPRE